MARTLLHATLITALVGAGVAVAVTRSRGTTPAALPGDPPPTLRETGLYARWDTKEIAADHLPFAPQYPLWSDGAHKRRWIHLPAGTAIDAHAPDAWEFPVGTQLWKEFAFERRHETRYMVRTAQGWRYATYAWNSDETEATRVPSKGTGDLPAEADCRACHGNAASPVLGFSALQLSPDRDPGALHVEPIAGAVDLPWLVAHDVVRGLPAALITAPPRIAGTPTQRAALGYLHGNCGGCHRAEGALAGLGMVLAHPVAGTPGEEPGALTTIGRPSHFMAPAVRIAPGDPAHSVLFERIGSRAPLSQMPPLGTHIVDAEAKALIATWIDRLAATPHEGSSR